MQPDLPESSLRFAYSTINWGTTPDLDETFAEIREAGWRAVELFWHDLGWLGTPADLRRRLAAHDLIPATFFGAVKMPPDPAQLVRMKNEITFAAELGASHYGLVGGDRLRWRPPTVREIADLGGFCEDLAEYGETLGVTVAYHPHVLCTVETEAEINQLLAATTTLTLCLDASHIALVDEDPISHLRTYRDRTGYVHLKDWGRGTFAEMGEGTIGIDFVSILEELDAIRFPEWVVIEQSRSNVSPLRSAQINAAALTRFGWDPGAIG